MIWVTSDIHGCLEEFKELVGKMNLTSMDSLYILGDLIDRGPDPIECIKYAKALPNAVVLKGNHEDMMLTNERLWQYNGGVITKNKLLELSEGERNEILGWVEALPIWTTVKVKNVNYLLVHAGLDCRKRKKGEHLKSLINDVSRQTGVYGEDQRLWIRDDFTRRPALKSHITVFGHYPTGKIPTWRRPRIWYGQPSVVKKLYKSKLDKIGIDCGCVYGGSLAALCLDTMKEIYVGFKEKNRLF